MHISAKSDYALRALIVMAQSAGSDVSSTGGPLTAEPRTAGPLTAEAMATTQEIPHNFLLAILADLRRTGIVRSKRGQGGGWLLARPATEITVADVIRAVDGPLVSVHGLRPEAVSYSGEATILQPVWIAARSSLREVLEAVSLADLAGSVLPEAVQARSAEEDAWEPH